MHVETKRHVKIGLLCWGEEADFESQMVGARGAGGCGARSVPQKRTEIEIATTAWSLG